ncbi:MAG: hypothetical protein SPL02_02890 [Bacilli bacterium]|nr:hypothetical protein [Bacilli bacterium]MDY6430845.1 hypothetical protein [Bacilli bacterium]
MPDNFGRRSVDKSKRSKKRVIIKDCIIGAVVIGFGVGVGIVAANFFKVVKGSNVVVDRNELVDDIDEVMAKYNSVKNASNLHEQLRPWEMIDVAMEKFTSSRNYFSVGVGYTNASIANQAIYASFAKNNDKYFEESISTGLINLYDRMYQEGDTTTTYWGGSANYSAVTPKTYDAKSYKELMGRNVSTPSSYIISKKTCLKSNNLSGRGVTSASKTSKGYQVEIELNPGDDKGVSTYRLQMKSISGLASLPSFYYCHLTFNLDFDLNFVDSVVYESYFAEQAAGIGAKMTASLSTKYYTYSTDSEAYKIPSLNETIAYSEYFK